VPALRPTNWQTQEKIFVAAGFVFSRKNGDHRIYRRPGTVRPVVIPQWSSVPVDFILSNMRTAEMSRDRYFELLASV
jgi:predicted RNA binding protein YcfA (HicA-like mRNA interferase family)